MNLFPFHRIADAAVRGAFLKLGVLPSTSLRAGLLLFLSIAGVNSYAGPKSPSAEDSGGMTVEAAAKASDAAETPAEKEARLAWWRDAKFGMFIHWGMYSVPAKGEWFLFQNKTPVAQYRDLAKEFTASAYDPLAWAKLAREAGMKYMVITAKHHDGFAMWPTKVSAWNVVQASPAARDLIGPLEKAARKEGIRFGLYYSQAQDWVNPGGAKNKYPEGEGWDPAQKGSYDDYLKSVAAPQVSEILDSYHPDIIWWDTPANMTPERAKPIADLVKKQPAIIMNNRLGGGYAGDTKTPEQFVPITGYPGDWETCMTINNSWGFNAKDDHFKSSTELIRKLADICSKGGNFLLNIGPDKEGSIPAPMVESLKGIGKWIAANGESIYGTRRGPFRHLSWGCATSKGSRLYLHVFNWPADGKLRVPLLNSSARASLLANPGKMLPVSRDGDALVIAVPPQASDPADTVVVMDLKEEAKPLPPVTLGAKVTADSTAQGNPPENVIEGSGEKRWKAAEGVHSAILEVELVKPERISSFGFDDPDVWPRVSQKYLLEALVDGTWVKIAEGKTKGHGDLREFERPVTSRIFRLSLDNEKGAPCVSEIEFYRPE